KQDLADKMNAFLNPLQTKIRKHLENPDELKKILDQGAQRASMIAEEKMKKVRAAIGVTL
ncbi:MAG: tryptophan--tRNA ligase, partial [Planctomycetota bacterium]